MGSPLGLRFFFGFLVFNSALATLSARKLATHEQSGFNAVEAKTPGPALPARLPVVHSPLPLPPALIEPPPPVIILPPAPACSIVAHPAGAKNGEPLRLGLVKSGAVTSAFINGSQVDIANPFLTIPATTNGVFTATGEVDGPGGTSACSTTFTVDASAPACSLVAAPGEIRLGNPITLQLNVSGDADQAMIDGNPVDPSSMTLSFTPAAAGTLTSTALVTSPSGTGSCSVTYIVDQSL